MLGREDRDVISSGNRFDLGRLAGHADGPLKRRKVSFSRSAGQHPNSTKSSIRAGDNSWLPRLLHAPWHLLSPQPTRQSPGGWGGGGQAPPLDSLALSSSFSSFLQPLARIVSRRSSCHQAPTLPPSGMIL